MYSHFLNARHSGGDFSEDAAFGVRSFRAQFWVPSAVALNTHPFQKSDQGSQKTRVDASDVTGCSRAPRITQPSFLQPLHSPDSSPGLPERGRGLALPAQTSSRNAGSDGKGALEVLMIIRKQCSPVVPFWSVMKHSICLQVLGALPGDRGMLRLRTTRILLLSPSRLVSVCLPVLPIADSLFPCLIFGDLRFWVAAAGAGRAHQDGEEQREGKSGSAFAAPRGGM